MTATKLSAVTLASLMIIGTLAYGAAAAGMPLVGGHTPREEWGEAPFEEEDAVSNAPCAEVKDCPDPERPATS
jgi:hypothetical protein